MTRRKGSGRTTQPGAAGAQPDDRLPSLRERNPVAFWVAILGVVSMVLGFLATALSAFL